MVIGIRGLVRGGVALAWFAALGVWGQEAPAAGALVSGLPESLSREVDAAMGRGAAYLLERQRENGSWQDMPAITGLACMGLRPCRLPQGDERRLAAIERGRQYVLAHVQDDGAICTPDRAYVNYSTAVCLSALAVLGHPDDVAVMRRSRRYLLGQQLAEDHPTQPTGPDDPHYGG
ncbi:MAG: hypothetical protein GX595_15640, partial [Lentisphaerae bacterium]|nr:hypothetical protein [Lentisphaerota bacterium]